MRESTTPTESRRARVDLRAGFGDRKTLSRYIRQRLTVVRAGEFGVLPIVLALALIVAAFASQSSAFLTSSNFVNLMVQMAGLATISMGIVFVLLVAEIDLSIGFLSGLAGVVAALLMAEFGVPGGVALLAALATGAIIGIAQGGIVAKAGVPSFVVTLAGLLAWNGLVLVLMAERGTIIIQDDLIISLANGFLSDRDGWIAAGLVVVGYLGYESLSAFAEWRSGVQAVPWLVRLVRIGLVTGIAAGVVIVANEDRGIPYAIIIVLLALLSLSYLASRTRFGRHVYAVGGSAEAARRAGIDVERIKITCFMLCGILAGLGGLILASRIRSVNIAAGSGEVLLNAIAAAVIGGVSLFGGRGQVKGALLGALVIASVANGMGLMGLAAGVKFMVTGGILLSAVAIDAFSRRRLANMAIR